MHETTRRGLIEEGVQNLSEVGVGIGDERMSSTERALCRWSYQNCEVPGVLGVLIDTWILGQGTWRNDVLREQRFKGQGLGRIDS